MIISNPRHKDLHQGPRDGSLCHDKEKNEVKTVFVRRWLPCERERRVHKCIIDNTRVNGLRGMLRTHDQPALCTNDGSCPSDSRTGRL